VLLSIEGINGTLSAKDSGTLERYIASMEAFDLIGGCGVPDTSSDGNAEHSSDYRVASKIYSEIDWKMSQVDDDTQEPFPDLKVCVVDEIVSTGGTVHVDEIIQEGGQHLSPLEFHEAIRQNQNIVLIDVRNTFEWDVGHFVNPSTQEDAISPEMVTFSSFDSTFCAKHSERLRDKKVLMYCTGGIRCEKASVMLKKRGVRDVSQLKGGIHRYLEEYGDQGFFKGRNFVFDQVRDDADLLAVFS
jgi:predicted sulfurtransferase